jgi:hypothetical protein
MHMLSTGIHNGKSLRTLDVSEKPRNGGDFLRWLSPSVPCCTHLPTPVVSESVAGIERERRLILPLDSHTIEAEQEKAISVFQTGLTFRMAKA